MFRPVRTDAQARHCPLSVDYLPLWGPRGITSLSLTASGGANLGEGCRDFDVGKIAESARFAEEEDLSLKTDFVSSSEASYGWLPSVAFVERHRGQEPLNFDNGEFNEIRFATRAWALRGESQVSNYFVKNR